MIYLSSELLLSNIANNIVCYVVYDIIYAIVYNVVCDVVCHNNFAAILLWSTFHVLRFLQDNLCLENLHNAIPYSLWPSDTMFLNSAGAAADSRQDSGTSSRLFEVNAWMWRYGRAFPRKISVKDSEEMRRERVR
jgi:hypothetical protein